MKASIVGAGMGGLAVAALLTKTGQHEVILLEQAPALQEAGYGIGLYPLGAMVYNAIGRGQQLRDKAVVLNTYQVHGPDGKLLQSIDLSDLLSDYGPLLGVTRTDLISILQSAVPDGVIRFDSRAESASLVGDHFSATLANGQTIDSDILIAADGMHSAIRRSLFGKVAPHETGFDAWMWWAPLSLSQPDTVSEFWGPSAFVGLYPMRDFINVAVAIPKDSSPDTKDASDRILQMATFFSCATRANRRGHATSLGNCRWQAISLAHARCQGAFSIGIG